MCTSGNRAVPDRKAAGVEQARKPGVEQDRTGVGHLNRLCFRQVRHPKVNGRLRRVAGWRRERDALARAGCANLTDAF